MNQIHVKTANNRYKISIGNGILCNLTDIFDMKKYSKIVIVSDENVAPLYAKTIFEQLRVKIKLLITIKSGDKKKNIESAKRIWSQMLRHSCDRKSLMICLGGGVICDMGGFAASTYMRGIDFIHMPTTLLAQVDASVGGKTGINLNGIKNLIGTFSQPKAVIIDTNTLQTLPKREFTAGFAEIIKHGLIRDKKYFKFVTSKKPLEYTKKELMKIITQSCKIKKEIVEMDEKESDVRKILNLGHTIGHAVETLSHKTKNPLLHGEAISIGMNVEAKISCKLDLLSKKDVSIINQALSHAGLPTEIPYSMLSKKILEKIMHDKKNKSGELQFTLLKKIGTVAYDYVINKKTINGFLNQL